MTFLVVLKLHNCLVIEYQINFIACRKVEFLSTALSTKRKL